MSTERPIIFSAPMIRAILAGGKTQTRRVMKPQPIYAGSWGRIFPHELESGQYGFFDEDDNDYVCRHGRPGTFLWVRETWAPVDDREVGGGEWIDYKATPFDGDGDNPPSHPAGWHNDPEAARAEGMRWRSPIFMPRTASRITLEIVRVRAERVQAISESDAHAEGCLPDYGVGVTAKSSFIDLWFDLYPDGPKSWESNPWVWAIQFKRKETS